MISCRSTSVKSLLHKGRILTAIGATSLALVTVAQGTALGEPVQSHTGDRCYVQIDHGTTLWFDDGSTLTTTDANAKKTTYTCKNGTWVQTNTSVFSPATIVATTGGAIFALAPA